MPTKDDPPEFRSSPQGSEAARWAALRMDRQRWTSKDEAEFRAWMERSPLHAEEMAELDATLGLMGRQEYYDAGAIAGILKRHAPARPVFRYRMPAMAAAMVVLGLTVWFWLGATESYSTGIAERREVVLQDGTLVKLDAGTRLKSRMLWWGRRVELITGEAVFTMAEDPSRPFMVHAGRCNIRDIGTVFSVHMLAPANGMVGEVEIAVQEGAVEMSSAGATSAGVVKLTAGESAAWDGRSKPPVATAFDASNFASWREGRRHYVDCPLLQIIADLQRYTQDRLELYDVSLAEMKVSGTLSMDHPEKAFDVLSIILPLKIVRENGRILFEREAGGKKSSSGSVR